MAFQEEVDGETKRRNAENCVTSTYTVAPSGKRTVSVIPQNLPNRKMVKHLSPYIQVGNDQYTEECNDQDTEECSDQDTEECNDQNTEE